MRHMPAGGRLSAGIVGAFFVAPRCCAPTQCIGATAAATRKAKVIVNCFISPPIGTGLGAHPHSSRANATGQLDQLRCNNKQIIHLSFHYCSGRYFDCPSRGNSVSLHPDSVGGGRSDHRSPLTVHRRAASVPLLAGHGGRASISRRRAPHPEAPRIAPRATE